MKSSRVTECENPVLFSDVPDAQIVNMDDVYYLFSSSNYTSQGISFISSRDLVHWKPAGRIQDPDYANTPMKCVSAIEMGGKIYVMYYSKDADRNILYSTDSISEGNWDVSPLESSYQNGSLFLESDILYFVYAEGDDIIIRELGEDFNPAVGKLSKIITPYVSDKLISHPKVYHIGEWYYLLLTEQDDDQYSRQLCGRSKELSGEYQFEVVLDGNFETTLKGLARSSLLKTEGDFWYAICGTNLGAYGYGVSLQPVTWLNEWPMIGEKGMPIETFKVSLTPHLEDDQLFVGDDFSSNTLSEAWQLLENVDSAKWSLTENPGWLRIYSNKKIRGENLNESDVLFLHRVSSNRAFVTATMYIANMKRGQYSGIASYQDDRFGMIGVHMNRLGRKHFVWQEYVDGKLNIIHENKEVITSDIVQVCLGLYPKIKCVDGIYKDHTYSVPIIFYVPHKLDPEKDDSLLGMRFTLFNYTTEETGGSVDFGEIQIDKLDKRFR